MSLALAAIYFVAVFGFFEAVLFKNKIDYWTSPGVVSLYFVAATVCALAVFSFRPLELALSAHPAEIAAVLALGVVLFFA